MVPRGSRHPLVLLALGLILLPWLVLAFGYTWAVATEIAIFALVGIGYNLLLGYAGLLSFGHGMFFGLAAYCAALTQIHWFGGSMLPALVVAVACSALLGLLVGFLALRRSGVYFSLVTLVFATLAFYIVYRWTGLTGSENGLPGLQRYARLDDARAYYYAVSIVVFVVAWLLWRVAQSPLGSVLVAIRENEQRARLLGYPVHRYRLAAFTVSAAVVGLGGALAAYLGRFVSADLVHVTVSGEIVAMAILGGMGNFLGPALGAFLYLMFRELVSGFTAAWPFWFALLFMALILHSPLGIVGLGERLLAPLRRSRTDAAAPARVIPHSRPVGESNPEVPVFLRAHAEAAGALLGCHGLTKRFSGFVAVDGVDLQLHDRRLHALIGPNGAGKTTLLDLISGVVASDSGSVEMAGTRIGGLPPEEVMARGVARSFQINSLFPALTVREHLRLAVQARHPQRFQALRKTSALQEVDTHTQSLLCFLGLEGVGTVEVSKLAYGGQRLVEIGVALAARPRALLLDEPLVGLTAAERARVTALLRDLAQHMAVLLVDHDIDRVFAMADTITVMSEGRVLIEGDAQTVRAHPEVQRLYVGSGQAPVQAREPRSQSLGDTVLSVSGIDMFYGDTRILHDVSFEVRAGEVVALLGRNGAGKSSTFKSIMGMVQPRKGAVTLERRRLNGLAPERIARLGVGLVPQGCRLFADLTVEENLRLGALSRSRSDGTRWERERIYEVFPKVREKLRMRADHLSGGEQQMVAIARAMAGNVKVVLLDEPFEGLPPDMVEEVYRSIEKLRREVSILIVEHHLDTVLSLADRAVVLERGRVTHIGPAAPLLSDLDFRREVLWA